MRLSRHIQVCLCVCLLAGTFAQAQSIANESSASAREWTPPPANLVALINLILLENPRVLAAKAAFEAALARRKAASKPLFNPELTLDAENAVDQTTWFGINQTIDWRDKRDARAKFASLENEVARVELASVRHEVVFEFLTGLADFHTALGSDELGNRRVELTQRFASITTQRRRAGDLSELDLDVAQLAFLNAKLEKARSSATLTETEQRLIAIVGSGRNVWPTLPADLPELQLDQLETDKLLNVHPVIRAKQIRVASLRAITTLRRRERHPDPTIGVRAGHEDSSGLVGLTLSLPLFVRNDFKAEVEASTAAWTQAEKNFQDTYLKAKTRVVSSAARYRVINKAWQEWQRLGQPNLNRQIDLFQHTWQAGELGTTDYLVKLTQALTTQETALQLRGQRWRAWFDWLAATGRFGDWLNLSIERESHE